MPVPAQHEVLHAPLRPPYPEGSQIAYWQPRDGDSGNLNEIHIVPSTGGAGRSITRAIDRNMARSIWMPDGKSLLIGANDGTRVSLWLQPLDGPNRQSNTELAIAYCLSNPTWRLSVQTHKFIGIP